MRSTPMGQALVFGLLASSTLVMGGALGAYWQAPEQISNVLLAFASPALASLQARGVASCGLPN
jgi:hypothetical protein